MDKPIFKSLVSSFAFYMLLIFVVTLLFACSSQAPVKTEGYDSADIKKGGHLYDNWMKVVNKKTSGNHPLYPATSKKKDASTWRCKECHGWDYIGDKGRYKKGSHYTGIKGVLDVKGKSPESIYSSLTTGKHDFSKFLSPDDIWSLVKFIKEGTLDVTASLSNGDVANGKKHYAKACANCHGADGNMMDFKSKKDGTQGVGWLSNDNPQETLHKIRWGHPGSEMPSAKEASLSEQDAADILAYSKTLK